MHGPVFLTLADLIEGHAGAIHQFGGQEGIRDLALLESAHAQAEASFGGQWLHEDIFEMAAAYGFHICQNHPFFDGNKRAALAATLLFLELNGSSVFDPKEVLWLSVLKIAKGLMTKKEFAAVLRALPKERKK